MKKKQWIWLMCFVVALMVLVGWGWHQDQRTVIDIDYRSGVQANRPTIPVPAITVPTVNSQRLLADVEALSFERYTETDRRRAREYMLSVLEKAGWTPKTQEFENGINIYAEQPGTDPDAGSILVAGHYDTVEQSPGADDNATSVAVVLETARLLAQQPTRRALQLALFDSEEKGLLGSLAFADWLQNPDHLQTNNSQSGSLQTNNLQGVIVMDMVGYACHEAGCQSYPPLPIRPPTDRGDFLAIIGDQGHPNLISSFEQATDTGLPQILTLSIPTFGRLTPDLMRSDHVPFWRNGIGAVLVTDTANFRNPHYHQPSDTLDTLDQDFFIGAAQLVVNAATALLMD